MYKPIKEFYMSDNSEEKEPEKKKKGFTPPQKPDGDFDWSKNT